MSDEQVSADGGRPTKEFVASAHRYWQGADQFLPFLKFNHDPPPCGWPVDFWAIPPCLDHAQAETAMGYGEVLAQMALHWSIKNNRPELISIILYRFITAGARDYVMTGFINMVGSSAIAAYTAALGSNSHISAESH